MSKNSFTPSFSIGKASSSLFPIKSYKNKNHFLSYQSLFSSRGEKVSRLSRKVKHSDVLLI
jgi:hypothetical protein